MASSEVDQVALIQSLQDKVARLEKEKESLREETESMKQELSGAEYVFQGMTKYRFLHQVKLGNVDVRSFCTWRYNSGLHIAVKQRDAKALEMFLEKCPDMKVHGLRIVPVLTLLLSDQRFDPNKKMIRPADNVKMYYVGVWGQISCSALVRACLDANWKAASALVKHHRVDVNSRFSGSMVRDAFSQNIFEGVENWTVLHFILQLDYQDLPEGLLQDLLARNDLDVNAQDSRGRTPFFMACYSCNDNFEILGLDFVTDPRVDMSICADDGSSPFQVLFQNPSWERWIELLKNGEMIFWEAFALESENLMRQAIGRNLVKKFVFEKNNYPENVEQSVNSFLSWTHLGIFAPFRNGKRLSDSLDEVLEWAQNTKDENTGQTPREELEDFANDVMPDIYTRWWDTVGKLRKFENHLHEHGVLLLQSNDEQDDDEQDHDELHVDEQDDE
eukprot:gene105-748_t